MNTAETQLEKIKHDVLRELQAGNNPDEIKIRYLGRKSALSGILRGLKDLPIEQRKTLGDRANELRLFIENSLQNSQKPGSSGLDPTLPALQPKKGSLHPITRTERELREIFASLGFVFLTGPEVENDFYNFEALNIPPGHPARDMHDTFYLDPDLRDGSMPRSPLLLRTHISPMQVRVMQEHQPPLAAISWGRVFRREATDARHEHTWDYLEGFMVGEKISVAHLKWVLDTVLKSFFGSSVRTQLKPSYFPFVEPGFEVAMSCVVCGGRGCQTCGTGWIELFGAGMIHPNVFKAAGYRAGQQTGFAFGMGVSRLTMMKYGISDIRLLYRNDFRAFETEK